MDDLLTTKQLQDLLQLDRTTIYRMLNDGRLRGVRVGGQWRFPRQGIETWLREQTSSELIESKEVTGDTRATDVLPLYCIQPIQQVFAQTSDVGAVTTDLDGKPLAPLSNSCTFCDLILASAKGHARCQASWKKLADPIEKKPRLEKCHAGLCYARGRVVVGGDFIAMFFVGQFTVDDPKPMRAPTNLALLAQECEIDEKGLVMAARDIRVLEKNRAERLLDLLTLVAETYSHIGQERLDMITRLRKVAEIAGVPAA